jgi:hypothetical protein
MKRDSFGEKEEATEINKKNKKIENDQTEKEKMGKKRFA